MRNITGLRYLILFVLLIVLLPVGPLIAATNPTITVRPSSTTGDCLTTWFDISFSILGEVDDQQGFDVAGLLVYDANGTRLAADWNGTPPGMTYTFPGIFGHIYGMNPISARPVYIEMYDITSYPHFGYNTHEIYNHILNQVNNGAPLLLSMTYDPAVDVPDCANLPDQAPLVASAACVGEDLNVAIDSGNGSYNITSSTGSAPDVPAHGNGSTVISGPGKWDNLTVTETTGIDSSNLGNFRCRPAGHPVLLTPAHHSRTTNPSPSFTWTGITDANNYRIWLYSEILNAPDDVIIQNTGGATSFVPVDPLLPRRYFWRVRGRVNNIWSRWSVRFTLWIDPPISMLPAVQQTTPVPTIDLAPPNSRDVVTAPSTAVPTIAPPPLTPQPTIAPPNSR